MRIAYVTHNDVSSPLVRSQVLPYLRGLTREGFSFTLITYKRGRSPASVAEAHWLAIGARPGGSLMAKAIDVFRGVVTLVDLTIRGNVDAYHARSYLPATIVAVAGFFTRRPFIFDMRGFLGEEYVQGGHWTSQDFRYRVLRIAEGLLLRRASEVVVLTERAAQRLRDEPRYSRAVRGPVTVVPCAVDLSRFRPIDRRSRAPTLVYSGSLGMWYLLDEMLEVFKYAHALLPSLRFLVLNRDAQSLVEQRAVAHGVAAHVDVRSVDHGGMPATLAEASVGIALIRRVSSKLGASPIKVAEYLACGLPVVVNADLGDTDRLVRDYRAGHVLPDFESSSLQRAGEAVVALIGDDEARLNARRLAEEIYDVGMGVERYAEVYRRLAARSRRSRG